MPRHNAYSERKKQLTLTPVQLSLTVSTFIIFFHNSTFFSRANELLETSAPLISLSIGAFGLTLSVITLFSYFGHPIIQKIGLSALLNISSISSFYTDSLGATYDEEMIENIFGSNLGEAGQLTSTPLIISIFLFGILPSAAIWLVTIRRRNIYIETLNWFATISIGITIFMIAKSIDYKSFVSISRTEMNSVTYALQPSAILVAGINYLESRIKVFGIPFKQIGTDAKLGENISAEKKPVVILLAIGETARAKNFQVNGYHRPTNPEIIENDLINFGHVKSCATSTLASMRCIFSHFKMEELTFEKFATHENLIDIVKRAGFQVLWYDNDFTHSGAGVAQRIDVKKIYENSGKTACPAGDCTDSILVDEMKALIPSLDTDTLIVLHFVGSHFPYYRRYPSEYALFQPTCDTEILSDCTLEQITNSYDNSILFTDHVIGSLVTLLSSDESIASAFVYTSDHGESLGENGIYLHSAPMDSAPKEQFEVPMLMWASKIYIESFGLDKDCLSRRQKSDLSHDYVFHTTLGLLDIETVLRNPRLDLTEGCSTSR